MTLVLTRSLSPLIVLPIATVTPSIQNTYVLDAASEKAALIFQATKDGTINKIGFYVSAHTSTVSAEVELQTVGGDGNPTGTKVGSSTQATVSVTGTGWFEATMGTGAAVTRGTIYSAIVQQPSSSPGNFTIGATTGVYNTGNNPNFPFGKLFTTSWANHVRMPNFVIYYDDGTIEFIPGSCPATAINSHAINTGTTPDEIALRFQVKVPCRFSGAQFRMSSGGGGRTYDVILYDNSSTALSTSSFDTDVLSSSVNTVTTLLAGTEVDLSVDSTYRLAIKPTTASSQTFYSFDVNANAIMAAMEGGIECYWSQRTDGGSWSDTTTRRPIITPLLTAFDNAAGGGGGGVGALVGGSLTR